MDLGPPPVATCEVTNCCFISGSGENLPRLQSMFHGFLSGWLACLHVSQLLVRAWHLWRGRAAFESCNSLKYLSHAQLVGLCSLLYAAVDAAYFLTGTTHYTCNLPTMVSQTYPIALFGMPGTAIFTSAQALVGAKMYALMKDCSRGKQSYDSYKLTERVTFVYAFVSPVLYMFGAVFLSPDYVWTFGNYLYLAESVLIGVLLAVTAHLTCRALSVGAISASTMSRIWKLWGVCGGASLLGIVTAVCGSEPLVFELNQPIFDTMYLLQGYYMYYVFVPKPQILGSNGG